MNSSHFLPSQSSLRIHVPSTYQHEVFEKHNKFKKESDTECKETFPKCPYDVKESKESGNFTEIKNNRMRVIGNGSTMEYKEKEEKEWKNVKNVI